MCSVGVLSFDIEFFVMIYEKRKPARLNGFVGVIPITQWFNARSVYAECHRS